MSRKSRALDRRVGIPTASHPNHLTFVDEGIQGAPRSGAHELATRRDEPGVDECALD